ncbi:MAG: hypothetical protein HOY71_19320 [Nonomuraea sp.]|nr:hypothetical protein [Nonomuraea sp.]
MNDNYPTAAMRQQPPMPPMPPHHTSPTAPTAPSGTRQGLKVTPMLLSGALAVVVVMVLTVVFLATREPDKEPAAAVTVAVPTKKATPAQEPSQEASAQASPSDPPPTGSPKFTQAPDPCGLVDAALIKKLTLFPKKTQIYQEECQWDQLAPGHSLPDNMSFLLKLYVKVYPGDLAKAQQQFLAQRADAVLLSESFTPANPPIGEESWTTLYTLEGGTGNGPTKATVGVRVSNAVIMVTYQRRVPEDPQGRLLKGAQELAKAAADKLAAGG